MSSICSSNIGFVEWSDVGTFEHLLELLDVINDSLDVHPKQYSGARQPQDSGRNPTRQDNDGEAAGTGIAGKQVEEVGEGAFFA